MSRINASFILTALISAAFVPAAQAASLYTSRCEQLTGTTVNDLIDPVQDVEIVLREGTPPSNDRRRREHARISFALAQELGLTAADVAESGEAPQIRVSLGSGSPVPTAVFTVSAIEPEDPEDDGLRLAIWRPEDLGPDGDYDDDENGFYKLFGALNPNDVFDTPQIADVYGLAPSATFVVDDGAVTRVAHFTEPNASVSKQFRECVELRGDDRLAVLVPHGGGIETKISGELATLLTDLETYGHEPSVWEASGQFGGNTHERWHITATQISGASFPGYGDLEDSGEYQYSLALHGFSRGERAIVMGGRSSRRVKCYLVNMIENYLYWRTQDERITYKIYAPDGPPIDIVRESTGTGDHPTALTGVDEYDGLSPDNIVNRISPNATGEPGHGGIQLELSSALRNDTTLFHDFIRGLALALDGQIDVPPLSNFCAQYE